METKNTYQKLANAKRKFGPIKKITQGFGYKYADLGQVIEAIQCPLLDNGLDFIQPIINNKLSTNLINIDTGEIITLVEFEVVSANITKANDLQQFGGGITYLRRYSLLTGFGLASEDNDAKDTNNKILKDENTTQVKLLNVLEEKINIINSIIKEYHYSDDIKLFVEKSLNDKKNDGIFLDNLIVRLRTMKDENIKFGTK